MRLSRRLQRLALGVGLGVAAVVCATVASDWTARADQQLSIYDPITVVVGEPPGFAVQPRLDPARLGRTPTLLPAHPKQLWRRELSGGVDVVPLVDDQGGLIASLVSAEVVRLAVDGRRTWRAQLDSYPAATDPVIAGDGSVVVVSGDSKVYRIDKNGDFSWKTALGDSVQDGSATPLALDDGSVVVAVDGALVRLDARGSVSARTPLPWPPVGGLIAYEHGTLAVTAQGRVYHWRPPYDAKMVGDFGGAPVGGAILVGPKMVLATINSREVVALDLLTRKTTPISGGAALVPLEGPPSLGYDGVLHVSNMLGEMFGYDGHGAVVRSANFENLSGLFMSDAGSMFSRMSGRVSPPLIIDSEGRAAFVRSNGRLGMLQPDDSLDLVAARVCNRPLALLPAGPRRMYAVCRMGSVVLFGDPSEIPAAASAEVPPLAEEEE